MPSSTEAVGCSFGRLRRPRSRAQRGLLRGSALTVVTGVMTASYVRLVTLGASAEAPTTGLSCGQLGRPDAALMRQSPGSQRAPKTPFGSDAYFGGVLLRVVDPGGA